MRIGFIGDSLTQGVPGSAYFPRLQQMLPEYALVNLGRAGGTVSSLLRRIEMMPQHEPFDLAFLWVGVNDVISDSDWFLRLVTLLGGQRQAANRDAFEKDYLRLVTIVQACATHVVLVSPLFKGENPQEELNQRLGQMTDFMGRVATEYEGVAFLDLHTEMMSNLQGSHCPGFRSRPSRVLWDILTAKSDAKIDRKSARRGYALSLDGLHLNSRGADWVAGRFLKEIRRQLA